MPVTRRRALQISSAIVTSMLSTACGIAPQLGNARPLQVWTLHTLIDDSLARWRRLNPHHAVTRIPVAPDAFVTRLQNALAGAEALPDVIVANTDILAHLSAPGILHPLDDRSFALDTLAPVGVMQCRSEDNRLLALPLGVNPLGVWYRSDIMRRANLPQKPENVQQLMGMQWQSFFALGASLHAALPDVAWVADAFSDVFVPLSQTTMPIADAAQLAFATQQQRLDGSAPRESGAWFDRLQRDSIAMVTGGSWMLPILARTTRPEEFPWRVIPTPNGCIAGASVAIAIMESSNNQEVATQLAYDLVFDRDMQLALSDSASLIPALMNTYTDGRFMRTESFCAGQKVGHLWTSAAQTMQGQAMSVHSAQRNADVRQIVIAALNGTLAYADALGQLATV